MGKPKLLSEILIGLAGLMHAVAFLMTALGMMNCTFAVFFIIPGQIAAAAQLIYYFRDTADGDGTAYREMVAAYCILSGITLLFPVAGALYPPFFTTTVNRLFPLVCLIRTISAVVLVWEMYACRKNGSRNKTAKSGQICPDLFVFCQKGLKKQPNNSKI